MNCPLISVIIPIYNVEAYLERCLDSVINNTYKNIEIICVNDGSPDRCNEILDKYAKMDARIYIINQNNSGLSAARNKGIQYAHGDFFYFLDSDDWIHHDAFRLLISAAEKSKADVIIGGYAQVSSTKQFDQEKKWKISDAIDIFNFNEAMNKPGYLRDTVWGSLYRKDVVAVHRFPEKITAYSEDAFFNLLIASSGVNLKYTFVNAPLYAYFNRLGSIMHNMTPDKRLKSIKHWITNIEMFGVPQYAMRWILLQLYGYGRTGIYCKNAELAKHNIRKAIHECKSYLWSCRHLRMKQIVKLILAIVTPNLYFKLLCRIDPTYLTYEDALKLKNKDIILTGWDDI